MIYETNSQIGELEFYPSKIMTIGLFILSFIFSAFFTLALYIQINEFTRADFLYQILIVLALLFCYAIFIRRTYKVFSPSLLLKVNKDGLFSPTIGFLSWKEIKNIEVGKRGYGRRSRILAIKIVLLGGKYYYLNTYWFTISPMEMLRLLSKYHNGVPHC